MEWNWSFTIENNYPRGGWDYWLYGFAASGWEIQGNANAAPGRFNYSGRLPPEGRKITLRARTKNGARSPKTLELSVGCFSDFGGVQKSRSITFRVKESNALFPNWHYYCDEQYMADSYYDTISFDVYLTLREDGELEVMYKENKPA